MYKLLHEKANAFQEIYTLTERLAQYLDRIAEEDTFSAVVELLSQRKAKMDEIDALNKRIRFLEESGYPGRDQEREDAQRQLVIALLNQIQSLDEQNNAKLASARDLLVGEMKEVRDGQKSIQAYGTVEGTKGQELDMLR